MELGQVIKKRREDKKMSQQELADKAGITQATVSRLEKDSSDIKLSHLKNIAAALGCSVITLITSENKKID